jgi:hypothetical protein
MWLMAGLGFIASAVGFFFVPRDVLTTADRRIDWIGAGLITVGLVLLQFVIADGENASHGWKTPCTYPLICFSLFEG